MKFWTFLDRTLTRLPGWPTERQWVTMGLFVLTGSMLKMAEVNPKLWDVKLFEILIQAVILTGIINMVLAFHFSANKSDETKSANTGKLADAFTAVAQASGGSDVAGAAAGQVADAAQTEADKIKDAT